eukprot:TRINITY_DN27046_c0_g1_i1.p1 TRINITY_DN27046_c0_g1~~TRINITY_DN27046_c0_g1_i1.p1  ORF type:complete len:225 (+),score=43.56 TRINITY_DN27046_c0_g1_i1:143-817(+)
MGSGAVSKEQLPKKLYDIHYITDPAKRWALCEGLGKQKHLEEAFHAMNKIRNGHVAASIGLGVAIPFTAGATAGFMAGEIAQAQACELNFLAYVAQKYKKKFPPPPARGEQMYDPKKIGDLQLLEVCTRLAGEEGMTAEYCVLKAHHDVVVTKIAAIIASLCQGGADMCFEMHCVQDYADTIKSITDLVNDSNELIDLTKEDVCGNMRAFIRRAMRKRRARLED